MTVIVAVTDSREGRNALVQAVAEAKTLGVDLVAVNLGARSLDTTELAGSGVAITVVDGSGNDKDDAAEAVLDEIEARRATRLVIGVKRRSPIGKVFLGSLSQQLLLHSPVPVLAVKLADDGLPATAFDNLPAGMRRVTG